MKKISSILSLIIVQLIFNCVYAQSSELHIINTFHISGTARWDYLRVGPVNDWLYVSHGTEVSVLNKKTGDSIAVIPNTTGVHGIAFDSNDGKGFTSNGRLNSVTVFDINANKVLGQIPTSKGPDAIFYEPYSKKIITCHGQAKNINVIDPVAYKVTDSIDVGGSPEEAVSDGEGNLFVNIEDKSEIVKVNLKTSKVVAHWSLAPAEGPTGLAIDTKTKRLFAGCNKLLVIMDADNGKVINSIPIGSGCDGTAFDAATKDIYASCGDGTLSVIHEESANRFIKAATVVTKRGARTLALDNVTHRIYLPTADFEPMQPGETGRPKAKDNSFQVLVVGK